MRPIGPGMTVLLATLLAGCASMLGHAVETDQWGDGTIVIRGRYSESSHSLRALDQAMTVEANKRCPSGWTKVDDQNNPYSFTGGRIWRVRCTSGVASMSTLTAAPSAPALAPTAGTVTESPTETTAAAANAPAPRSAVAIAIAPNAQATATGAAAHSLSAASPAGTISREDLVRMLADAVKRASPYLTDSAAEAIVAEQLRTLANARVGVLGPDGQPLLLLPAP